MEKLLSIVEEQPSVVIDESRLRKLLSHTKVWEFIKISEQDYKYLPATNRYSVLQDYCEHIYSLDMLFCLFCC